MQLRRFLVDLTSRRAVNLFVGVLCVGSVFIAANLGLPWTPALLVAAYGSVLLYCAGVLLVTHSDMTNNSPYFLGFLFFLISLLRSFLTLSSFSDAVQLDQIVHQMGGALLATVVGLPFRQLLFAYSPSQAEQDTFFRTLEEELRRSATEFKRSQVELIQLVHDFVETRKMMFSDEEKASRQYIRSLQDGVKIFEESAANYPSVISSALSSCAASLKQLEERSQALAQSTQNLTPDRIRDIASQFAAVSDRSGDLAHGLNVLNATLIQVEQMIAGVPSRVGGHLRVAQSEFDDVRRQLRDKLDGIQGDVAAIDALLTDFVALTRERIGAVR